MHPSSFSGELIFFSSLDGIRLSGFLVGDSPEVILFVHGMGGNFQKENFLKASRILMENDLSFFSFNTRGAEVVKDFKDEKGEHHLFGTAFERFEDSVLDIQAAIDLLESRGFRRFHLMGHSTGCQKILYCVHSTKDERVKSLIHISPADDYEIWRNELGDYFSEIVEIVRRMVVKGEGDKLIIPLYERTGALWSASRFLSFALRENPEARMFNYEDLSVFGEVQLPTQIFLGKDDPYFLKPLDWYAERLRSAYRGRRLEIEIMPGDHSFHGYEEELFERVAKFVREV
jgi:pimeloyl-ACP methyl ester carboxylesterase